MTFDPAAWPGLADARANPGFRPAIQREAELARNFFRNLPVGDRWLMADRGRFAMGLAALLLAAGDAFTAAALTQVCKSRGLGSAGRATKYVEHLLRYGHVSATPSRGHWTNHRLTLGPTLMGHYRTRLRCALEALAMMAPEAAPALAILDSDEFLPLTLTLEMADRTNPSELGDQIYEAGMGLFLERDCGVLILQDLMLSQPSDRSRLLERASISRYALARDYGVSRPHINKLLADAAAAGFLSLEDDGATVAFSQMLSDVLECQSAAIFKGLRAGVAQYLASRPAERT